MGFDTMRSFQHLGLGSSSPCSPNPRQCPTSVRRQDSLMFNETNANASHMTRTNRPSSLPGGVPSFQATKAKWSPPSSPIGTTPATTPGCSAPDIRVSAPSLSAQEKNTLTNNLYSAACSGDLAGIELLLSMGAPINSSIMVPGLFEAFKPAKAGPLSPLAGAASNGQLNAVELLVAHGADINLSGTRCASSPLHQAIRHNDFELCRLLLEFGADVNIDNAYKTTPIMYAVKYASAELVSLLLQHKPDIHKLSFTQSAAIHWSVWPGDTNITEMLLKVGANPNHPMGHTSNSPLHCAVVTGSKSMVECLLRYGANPLQRNEENQTAIDLAATQSDTEEIMSLLKAAANVRR